MVSTIVIDRSRLAAEPAALVRASLAQINTEMTLKYAKLAEKYAKLGKAAKFHSLYDIGGSNPVPASGL